MKGHTVYVSGTSITIDGYAGFRWSCTCGRRWAGYRDEQTCRDEGAAHQRDGSMPRRWWLKSKES